MADDLNGIVEKYSV